jgi:CHAT domain-containing protein
LSRSAGFRLGESQALDGLARVALDANDIETARRYVEDALAIVESLRAGVSSGVLRASYVASVYRYDETQMDVLMRLDAAQPNRGFAAEAFEAGERARARALLEGLAEAGVDLRKDIAPALAQREQALEREFEAWAVRQRQVMATTGSDEAGRRLAAEYRDLEARHTALDAELRSKSPRYAALVRPRTLTLPQVQQLALDNDTVLLAFALGEQQSYLWAVWRTGYSVHRLPPRSRIEHVAQQVYDQLTARLGLRGSLEERRRQAEAADFLFWERARQLSDLLLEPVANAIAGKRLVVVADGALHYVPFAALPEPGGAADPVPLIVSHEIVSLPSASVIPVLRGLTSSRPLPPMSVAVLADPVFEPDDPRLRAVLRAAGRQPDRQPGGATRPPSARMPLARLAATREEAVAILAVAGRGSSVARLGFDASRAAATSAELAQYRTVHFATHGIFDNESPGMSGIMLSMFDGQGRPQDGFLRLHDIYALRLPAELVVLSACSTALGRQVRGEGLAGMVRGFMHAGARRVVASLWKVDDEATGDLMRRFYASMLRDGRSPAAALRAAQIAVRQQPRWASPFYWAAFSLQGEWKPSDGR